MQLICFERVFSNLHQFNDRNVNYLNKVIDIIKNAKHSQHWELTVKNNVSLKTPLLQGISEPVFYGDLVYKFRRNKILLFLVSSSLRSLRSSCVINESDMTW